MNKFDIERYEKLTSVKTDVGKQRAWIRSCLNEHCLERYIIPVLSNQTLLKYDIFSIIALLCQKKGFPK